MDIPNNVFNQVILLYEENLPSIFSRTENYYSTEQAFTVENTIFL